MKGNIIEEKQQAKITKPPPNNTEKQVNKNNISEENKHNKSS